MRAAAFALLSLVASAATAEVWRFNPAASITINCTADGSGGEVVARRFFQVAVVGQESVSVCYAASCPTGGMYLAPGNHPVTLIPPGHVSCRSDASAIVQLIPVVPNSGGDR